jgi:hypothetical protein
MSEPLATVALSICVCIANRAEGRPLGQAPKRCSRFRLAQRAVGMIQKEAL